MAQLLDLPTEVLQNIVTALPRSQDVAAVAATCKLLNRAASGELYENIRLEITKSRQPSDIRGLHVLVNLASSLFRGDPALRCSTKTITIVLSDLSTPCFPRLVPSDILDLLTGRAPGNARDAPVQWGITTAEQRIGLIDGHVWAYVTLMLHACRNIHTLTLDGNFFHMLEFWDTDLSAFEKLETVELITSAAPNVPRPPASAEVLEGLALIPNLRTLRLTASGDLFYDFKVLSPLFLSPYSSFAHLTVLVLWKCEMKSAAIRALLGHMPRLVTLEIDLLFAIEPRKHNFNLKFCLVDLQNLRKAILGIGLGGPSGRHKKNGQHCSNTLENLKISVDFLFKGFEISVNNMDRSNQVLPDTDEGSDVDDEEASDHEDEDDEDNDEDDDDDDDGTTIYIIANHPDYQAFPCQTIWEINGMGSLKRLKKLRKLEIEPMLLFGNLRSTPIRGNGGLKPGRKPHWAPLDTLLPESLEEFHIAYGPVSWLLLSDEIDFLRVPGTGADLCGLCEMFEAYKEGGGNLAKLRKVVHLVRRGSPCTWTNLSWNKQQMKLKDMLKSLGIGYEWPC